MSKLLDDGSLKWKVVHVALMKTNMSSTTETTKLRFAEPQIFEYEDLRRFLLDHFKYKKARMKHWSYGAWAKHLKFANTSVLSNIISGKRSPGKSLTDKFIAYFNFKKDEEEHFQILVSLSGNRQIRDSKPLLANLRAISNLQSTPIDLSTFEIISEWQHYAIREMTLLKAFQHDVDWIKSALSPTLSKQKILSSIDNLIRARVLELTTENDLRHLPNWVETPSDIANEGLKNFHESMIKLAAQSIRKVPVELRDIGGTTFNIRTRDLPAIKQSIREFRKALCAKYEAAKGEETYQLNVQFFPLTKVKQCQS